MEQDYQVPQRILEINRRHPLIGDLVRLVTDNPGDALINLSIEQLYNSALALEGLHPNLVSMLPRVQQLMELAAQRSLLNEANAD
jgi:molecular chaperone HtpG